MRKKFFFAFIALMIPMAIFGQSYDKLWKAVKEAQNKDLPKTEISALGNIVVKARKEHNYGQLLAAGLQMGNAQIMISPDSLKSEVERLARETESAKSPAMKAVGYAILGDIYKNNSSLGDDHLAKSEDYWSKAMAAPDLLAKTKATGYEPLIGKGVDSSIFNDDLLHVIGYLTGNFDALNKYYDAHGNKRAACLVAVKKVIEEQGKGSCNEKVISRLDSIISVYGDLDVCGQAAVQRYSCMPKNSNEEADAAYRYGEEILSRWPQWKGMGFVRNGQKSLISPLVNYSSENNYSIPSKLGKVKFSARNTSSVTLTVSRLNVDGNNKITDFKKLRKLADASTAVTVTKSVYANKPYYTVEDSIEIPALKPGVWLMELKSTNMTATEAATPSPSYELYYVSDMALLSEQMPEKKVRFVVVNATSGQPISSAKVLVSENNGYWNKAVNHTLTTDNKGEVVFNSTTGKSITAWPYTDSDRGARPSNLWFENYSKNTSLTKHLNLYTDRSIYRPGQTVHVGMILYAQDNDAETRHVVGGDSIQLTLRDANMKEVVSKTVATDKMGSASADFTLPSSGLTGSFSIEGRGYNCNAWNSFKVEEYKRPTFEVTFDEYADAYKHGDTITVTGKALTYAGVPVENSKVEYTINRRRAWWCWWNYDRSGSQISSGTAMTDADGKFSVKVPIVLPESDVNLLRDGKRIYHYYNIVVDAKVTNQSGESREGELSLPIGTRATVLSCDLPDKILRDTVSTVTFRRVNMAGKEIAGVVEWTLNSVGKQGTERWFTTSANKSNVLKIDKSGEYVVTAICGEDTISKRFVAFSASDKRPVVTTNDWFWQSGSKFPIDGKPVEVVFGTSRNDQHIVYSIISANNKVIEQGSVEASNQLIHRQFKYREEYGDGLVFNVAWVRDGQIYKHRATIERPEKNNKLKLQWKTFRNALVPGQKEEWTLTVLSPEGKPADAQLMATLYDKSLDQITALNWNFNPYYNHYINGYSWVSPNVGNIYGRLFGYVRTTSVNGLQLREINREYYNNYLDGSDGVFFMGYGGKRSYGVRMSRANSVKAAMPVLMAKTQNVEGAALAANDAFVDEEKTEKGTALQTDGKKPSVQLRENLDELAFFYPQLATDKSGNVTIKFTLPESVTTWRFLGLAHDAEVNYATITNEAVAKKTVMVQPNMPRFLRMGDKAQLAASIYNTSEKNVNGIATLEIIDPATEKVLLKEDKAFAVDSGKTTSCEFAVEPSNFVPSTDEKAVYVARITVSGDGFSDGEQHYLPVLSDEELVTNTLPFTLTEPTTKEIKIADIVPANAKNAKVKFEYTGNPSWLMLQALPYVGNASEKNAISLASALYANSLACEIMNSNPKIKSVFEQWQQDKSDSTSLLSDLFKNEDLKSLLLTETPWVADAERETESKRQLSKYFDVDAINNNLTSVFASLKNLQNPDGSFSWWPGMRGSFYMTVAVAKTLVRLQTMVSENSVDVSSLLKGSHGAFAYLDNEASKMVAEMKGKNKKGQTVWPSDALCDYVYINALAGRSTTSDIKYIVDLLLKQPRDLTIYGKANSAVILAMYGHKSQANEYLKSIKEYMVYKEDAGLYFDTPKAQYSWFNYKIPTQTSVIEAYRLLAPSDKKTITDLQRWLLHEKHTQAWETPLSSVDAIYAFMGGDTATSRSSDLNVISSLTLSIGNSRIELPKGTAGIGYVTKDITNDIEGKDSDRLMLTKTSTGTSWGSVYAQFKQPVENVEKRSSGLTVERKVIADKGTLKVGDKVKVRITIKADRDYDFVQVVDRRAACLEPVNQLSGYRMGYYIAPRDYTTCYYFDRLAKGTHVVETEYYIDRAGNYLSGTCVAQCAYAPEFSGLVGGEHVNVVKE